MSDDFLARAYAKWQKKYKGDEVSYYMKNYCKHCGEKKKDCTGYKCWI